MGEPVTESDILALVEGTVPADRVEEIRAALRADPVLRARIEKMAADRDRLARLSDRVAAPADTVARAMHRAAAEVHGDPGAKRRRTIAMVAAAGVGIAVLAGVMAIVVVATHPDMRASRVAGAPAPTAPQIRPVGEERASGAVEMIGPIAEAEDDAGPAPTTTAEDIAMRLAELQRTQVGDPVLEEFLRNIDAHAESAPVAGSHEVLTDAALARLAREGRIEIVVITDGALGTALAGDGAPGAAPVAIPGAIPVDIPVDGADGDVRKALDRAVAALRADAGVRVEFRGAEGGVARGVPSSDPRAVVWWSQGPEQWRAVRTVVVPVRRVPATGG
jgi:hypothetical protein